MYLPSGVMSNTAAGPEVIFLHVCLSWPSGIDPLTQIIDNCFKDIKAYKGGFSIYDIAVYPVSPGDKTGDT